MFLKKNDNKLSCVSPPKVRTLNLYEEDKPNNPNIEFDIVYNNLSGNARLIDDVCGDLEKYPIMIDGKRIVDGNNYNESRSDIRLGLGDRYGSNGCMATYSFASPRNSQNGVVVSIDLESQDQAGSDKVGGIKSSSLDFLVNGDNNEIKKEMQPRTKINLLDPCIVSTPNSTSKAQTYGGLIQQKLAGDTRQDRDTNRNTKRVLTSKQDTVGDSEKKNNEKFRPRTAESSSPKKTHSFYIRNITQRARSHCRPTANRASLNNLAQTTGNRREYASPTYSTVVCSPVGKRTTTPNQSGSPLNNRKVLRVGSASPVVKDNSAPVEDNAIVVNPLSNKERKVFKVPVKPSEASPENMAFISHRRSQPRLDTYMNNPCTSKGLQQNDIVGDTNNITPKINRSSPVRIQHNTPVVNNKVIDVQPPKKPPGPQPHSTRIQIGMLIRKWIIISRIGAGSFGETFCAAEINPETFNISLYHRIVGDVMRRHRASLCTNGLTSNSSMDSVCDKVDSNYAAPLGEKTKGVNNSIQMNNTTQTTDDECTNINTATSNMDEGRKKTVSEEVMLLLPERMKPIGLVCIKVEQDSKNVLRMEVLSLKKSQVCSNVVRYIGSGHIDAKLCVNYLVMEKLGPNLVELKKCCPHGVFDIYTTFKTGISCLEALKGVHEQGIVHRDVKPSNFVVGLGPDKAKTCYLIDFGLARRFRRANNTIRPPRENAGFRGTNRYASIRSHHNQELGRVDDLWSLLFMLVEFATGTLPWRKFKEKDAIGECKVQTVNLDLVKTLPRELTQFMEHLLSLSYESDPDYDYLKNLLCATIVRRGYPPDKQLDWEKYAPGLLEIGEGNKHVKPQILFPLTIHTLTTSTTEQTSMKSYNHSPEIAPLEPHMLGEQESLSSRRNGAHEEAGALVRRKICRHPIDSDYELSHGRQILLKDNIGDNVNKKNNNASAMHHSPDDELDPLMNLCGKCTIIVPGEGVDDNGKWRENEHTISPLSINKNHQHDGTCVGNISSENPLNQVYSSPQHRVEVFDGGSKKGRTTSIIVGINDTSQDKPTKCDLNNEGSMNHLAEKRITSFSSSRRDSNSSNKKYKIDTVKRGCCVSDESCSIS